MDAIRNKLSDIESRYKEVNDLLIQESTLKDPHLLKTLSKEEARLKQPVDAWHSLQDLDSRIEQAEQMKQAEPQQQDDDGARLDGIGGTPVHRRSTCGRNM